MQQGSDPPQCVFRDWDGDTVVRCLIRGLPALGQVRLKDELQHLTVHWERVEARECRGLSGVEHDTVAKLQLASGTVAVVGLQLVISIKDLQEVVRGHLQAGSPGLQTDGFTGFANLRSLGNTQDRLVIAGNHLRSFHKVLAHHEEVDTVAARLEDRIQHEAVRLDQEPGRQAKIR